MAHRRPTLVGLESESLLTPLIPFPVLSKNKADSHPLRPAFHFQPRAVEDSLYDGTDRLALQGLKKPAFKPTDLSSQPSNHDTPGSRLTGLPM